jgi:hypothetical protein
MDDPDAAVRRAAAASTAKILRIKLNYRPDAPPDERQEQIRKLRLWWRNPENSGLVGGVFIPATNKRCCPNRCRLRGAHQLHRQVAIGMLH